MSLVEDLIRSLLTDLTIEDFNESPVFHAQIEDHTEAVDILLGLMKEENYDLADRAQQMLSLFGSPVLKQIAINLSQEGALWRYTLLEVLWAIITTQRPKTRRNLLEDILSDLLPLFKDQDIVKPNFRSQPEVEYTYRVCDEVYVFCQQLIDLAFDESVFRGMNFDERDIETRILYNRLSRRVS